MPIVVVFLIFVVCLVIAIPVSISLGIVSVLPGAFDPSFTASAQFVIRSMFGESTVFHFLQCRCLCSPESLWQRVESRKGCLMFLEKELRECRAQ